MKKVFITASVAFTALIMMSFSTTDQDGANFNVVTNSELDMDLEVAEFVAYEKSKETADKVVWEKRYKTWSDFAFEDHISSIEAVINRN